MNKKTILVTGGAGYIGSHVVRQLGERQENIVVLDNLSTGKKEAVLHGEFVEGNMGDTALVDQLMQKYDIEAVLHFAAHTIVPESVTNPLKYYGNNTANTRNLLECCQRHGVKHFIFSSTAAVYGVLERGVAREDSPTQPINAYGSSKLMSEIMLRDLSAASELTHVILRYFNVAGCDPECRIGQNTPNATLLIKVASEVAIGKRDALHIFGSDYDTADGTGVRDFIHVEDLASAHLRALDYLRKGGSSRTFNCGYGHGYSVRQVVNALEQAVGHKIKTVEEPRRAGDPPTLIADSSAIKQALQWQPAYDDINTIVKTSLEWERLLQTREQQ